jgi:hypothetical protein
MSLYTLPITTVTISNTTKELKSGISKYEDITIDISSNESTIVLQHLLAPAFTGAVVFPDNNLHQPCGKGKTKLLPQQVLISHCLPVRT